MKKHAPSVFEIQSPLQRRCYPMLWSFRVWKFEGSGMEFAIFHLVWLAFATPPMGMLKIRSTALIFCIFLHNFRNLTSRACNLQLCRYQSRSFWTSKDTDPHQHVSNKPQAQDQNPDFWWVVYSIFYLQKEREREKEEQKQDSLIFVCQLLPALQATNQHFTGFVSAHLLPRITCSWFVPHHGCNDWFLCKHPG